jgi:hypothetical protein
MATSTHGDRKIPPRAAQPLLDWAIATKFAYLRAGDWLPLLVEFDPAVLPRQGDQTPLQAFTGLEWLVKDPRTLAEVLRIPELFTKPPELLAGAKDFHFCVVFVHRKQLENLIQTPEWNQTILRAEIGPPVDLPLLPKPPAQNAPTGPGVAPTSSQRVVIAVIDQGIAFAHARFRNLGGSRIAYLWQQEFFGPGSSMAPGVELTAAEIDAALLACGGDEDQVYRRFGGLDFTQPGYKALGRSRTHGTHVLDLAAGAAPSADVKQYPIIAVDMPDEAVGDPAASMLTVHAFLGLVYVLARAQSMLVSGEKLPIIVNLSYGPQEGPHDGNAMLEVIMDSFIKASRNSRTPMQIVLAGGNFRQSRVHAGLKLQPGRAKTLNWRLQPGSRSPSAMEIWLPHAAAGDISVTLSAPQGTPGSPTLTVSPTQSPAKINDASGNLLVHADYVPAGSGGGRPHVVLNVVRTAADPASAWGQAIAPSGIWAVNVTATAAMDVHAWIKRSDTPRGRSAKGRQSYFDDPAYSRFGAGGRRVEDDPATSESYVRRSHTLSGIATGGETVVVGAYRQSDGAVTDYSSKGPHLNPARTRNAPDMVAPGERTGVLQGLLAAGTRSAARIAMNGTSVAAPKVTRWLADQWQSAGKAPATLPPKI